MRPDAGILIDAVRAKNGTVDRCLKRPESLLHWIGEERARLERNNALLAADPEDDFPEICEEYLSTRFGKAAGEKGAKAIRTRALATADHLGGFYSPQSFQGDLFFGELLLGLKDPPDCVPFLPFGYVSIDSSTYARGIQLFSDTAGPARFPIFPRYPAGTSATLREGFDKELIQKTRSFILSRITEKPLKNTVKWLFDRIYLREDILSETRFPEQAVKIGQALMEALPDLCGEKGYYYIEAEEVLTKLFLRELKRKDGVISSLLSDPKARKAMNCLYDEDEKPLSSLLFRGFDQKKRDFSLNLSEDGTLSGESLDREVLSFPATPEKLTEMLYSRKILPGLYLGYLILGFLRGYSFFGGIFQSLYLPNWHALTCELFQSLGDTDLVKSREALDPGGYISGPIVLLSDTGDGAVNAGPLEALMKQPDRSSFQKLLNAPIQVGHEMGMFEFYNDTIPAREKKDGWYETFALYAKAQYPNHII